MALSGFGPRCGGICRGAASLARAGTTEGTPMHELALSRQVARIVSRAAAGRRVVTVHVLVGHLRQVVPEAFDHAWHATVRRTDLASAELVITAVPAVVACDACGAETVLGAEPRFDCGACGGTATRVVRGEEFRVSAIDVDDLPDAVASPPTTTQGG